MRELAEHIRALTPAQRGQLLWQATIAAGEEVDITAELQRGRELRQQADARLLAAPIADHNTDTKQENY